MKKLLLYIDKLKKSYTDDMIMSVINYEQKGEVIKEVSTDYNVLWHTYPISSSAKIIHLVNWKLLTKTNLIYCAYIYSKYLLYKILKKNISPIFKSTFNKRRNLKYLRAYTKYQKEALAIMGIA
jgi:hypothetical protein